MAVLAGAEQKLGAVPQQPADMVDRAIFARAEATEYDGNASVASMGSGDTQTITAGQSGTVSTMNGGTQYVSSGGSGTVSTMSGGTQHVSSGGSITVGTMSGGEQWIYSGGNVTVGTMNDGSILIVGGVGIVDRLSGEMICEISVDSGGSVTVSNIDNYCQLFAYDGTFTISTMSNGEQNIGSAGSGIVSTMSGGTQAISSGGLGVVSALNGGTQIISSGKLTFEGKEFNAGGLWDIDPTLAKGDTLGLTPNGWYLTKVAKTANNDTRVLLDAADNSYALWRNTNDSLRSRLGALGNGSQQADGIWARTQAGRFSGDNYEGRYNLYQFGYDKADNAKSIYGLAVDYGDGTGSYDNGSGKDKLKSFSLYSVWTADNGSYTNVTARYGIVATDLDSYGDYPDKAEYKQHAYSVSVEYGKRFELERGLFIEPNAQFTLGRLGGIDYTTDRGVNGRIDGMNSALGRIGFVMGQKIENGSDIYLKADLLHEFAGERDLQLTSDAGGTNDILTKHNDYGDTWFELGLGGNARISKTGDFYGEVTRGFGGDINKKWSVNAGLRFTF